MIILKFTKTQNSALVAHVDTLRAVTYVFRRANLPVEYSQGYNPHMELGFSSPIPLGTESLAEYVSAKCPMQQDILQKLNENCPQGVTFTAVYPKKVNLAATFNRAEYLLKAQGIGNVIDQILAPNYCICYLEKGAEVTKDVSARIISAERVDQNTAKVILTCGNENLRPDRLCLHIMNANNLQGDYSILKTKMFAGEVDADTYLTNLPND